MDTEKTDDAFRFSWERKDEVQPTTTEGAEPLGSLSRREKWHDCRVILAKDKFAEVWVAQIEALNENGNGWRRSFSADTIAGASALAWAAYYDAMASGEVRANVV